MDLTNLSDAEAAAASPAKPAKGGPAQADRVENPYEPMVHGESTYDRVTSMLMSVVIGAAIIVGWLWLVYYTNQAYAQRLPSSVQIIEVSGGGGSPEGEIGAGGESVDVPGAEAGASASNAAPEDASAFNEPAEMEAASSPALDALASPSSDSEGAEVASDSPTGGAVANGPRRSRVGKGGIGLGVGGGTGDGGVAREQRWVIEFPAGQTEEEYAKQLDALGVELGTFASGKTVVYGSNFSGGAVRRTGMSQAESRWYLTWAGQGRKQFDIALLKRAGIDVGGGGVILQFYPKKVEDRLARLEYDFKGRQPAEIRKTRFKVIPSGGGFDFQVASQDLLR